MQYSLVIAGAGSAGIACALTAAQLGIETVLLERSSHIGGTVSRSLIHTLGGLFDDQGKLLNPGLSIELIERLCHADSWTAKRRIGRTWTLSADPAVYAQVLRQWLKEEKNIQLYTQSEISKIHLSGGHIHEILFKHEGTKHTLPVHSLIDATGNAAAVQILNPTLINEQDSLAGLLFQLRGVSPNTLRFPQGVALLHRIRQAAEQGDLPSECATLWLDNGVRPDEVYIKFNLLPVNYNTDAMSAVMQSLLSWLHDIPGFSEASLHARGQLGMRSKAQIRGEYCLTASDIKTGKLFADSVCHAAWPIEHWHPEHGLSLDYLPPGQSYTIPMRSLKVHKFNNLFSVGKSLCADSHAQASVRVVGTCWAMGEGLIKNIFQKDQRCHLT